MTNEEINIAIAESLGYHCLQRNPLYPDDTNRLAGFAKGDFTALLGIPNYCNDLNAMHDAEESLDCNQWEMWHKIVGRHFLTDEQPYAARLTARQRAEAYLRTIGEWKEGDMK